MALGAAEPPGAMATASQTMAISTVQGAKGAATEEAGATVAAATMAAITVPVRNSNSATIVWTTVEQPEAAAIAGKSITEQSV